MSVGSYDPSEVGRPFDAEILQLLLAAASRLGEPDFGLDTLAVARLAPFAQQGGQGAADWKSIASPLDPAQLEALIRLFTLGERLPGWEAGAKSPVVLLAAELKRRDAYPSTLTSWIKANTENRFLPHGSLLDRL